MKLRGHLYAPLIWSMFVLLVLLITALGVKLAKERASAALPLIAVMNIEPDGHDAIRINALKQELAALGKREGIDYRMSYIGATNEAYAFDGAIASLISQQVKVFVCISTPCAAKTSKNTAGIPTIYFGFHDPIEAQFTSSLAAPSNNVTGQIDYLPLEAKRVELLKALVPGASQLVVLDDARDPTPRERINRILMAAREWGLDGKLVILHDATDVTEYAQAASQGLRTVAYIPVSAHFFFNRGALITQLNRARIPTIFEYPEFVASGGLVSLAPRSRKSAQVFAQLLLKIVWQGASASELPFERPQSIIATLNTTTAVDLGLRLSPSQLIRIDLYVAGPGETK